MFRVNAERMVNIGGVDLAKFLEWLHVADDFPQGALRQKIRVELQRGNAVCIILGNADHDSPLAAGAGPVVFKIDDSGSIGILLPQAALNGIGNGFVGAVEIGADRFHECRDVFKYKEARVDLLNDLDGLDHQRIPDDLRVGLFLVCNGHALAGRRCNDDIHAGKVLFGFPELQLIVQELFGLFLRDVTADVTAGIFAFLIIALDVEPPFQQLVGGNAVKASHLEAITADTGTAE